MRQEQTSGDLIVGLFLCSCNIYTHTCIYVYLLHVYLFICITEIENIVTTCLMNIPQVL